MQTATRREFLAFGGGVLAAAAVPGALAGRLVGGVFGSGAGETFFDWDSLAAGVHATVAPALGGNSMVITSGGEAMLIDTKFPAFAAALAREAEAFGSPITRIINTHHHGDHTSGNGVLSERVEIIAHAKAAERIAGQLDRYRGMAKGGPRQVDMERPAAGLVLEEAQAAVKAAAAWDAESFVPDITIDEWPHEVAVGKVKLVLHHFGSGHTDNDLVAHLPDLNIVHTGDLCFHGLHPFFDPDGGSLCREWSKSVAGIIKLCDAETVVVPGHGGLTDTAGLETQKRYLNNLWDRVAKEIRMGKTRDDVTAMSWDFMDGLGFEQIRSRAIGAVYDEIYNGK